jgi:hypothetical protein
MLQQQQQQQQQWQMLLLVREVGAAVKLRSKRQAE